MVKILEYNNKPGKLAKTIRMDISDFEKSIKDKLGHHMYYEKDGYKLNQRIKIDLGIVKYHFEVRVGRDNLEWV